MTSAVRITPEAKDPALPDTPAPTTPPRRHEVHTDPDRDRPCPDDLPAPLRHPPEGKSAARWASERLILYIRNFEAQLDNEQEIAMGFAGGEAGVIRIEGMGYFDPDIVTFYGSDTTGARTQLIQHVAQLSVMLRALPKARPEDAPRRIGFRLSREIEEAEPDDDAGPITT